ncbi:MAG TPA: GDP-mannose 4,6-dehydratase [Candidatus Bathyarchaeia archaeon]|nr:GDP-mannose 4,6-dehydratase [Candidatus Bathyarchaeia archaeon]
MVSKILITGGAGFIGSHLCERCISKGYTVFCLDNFLNGSLGNIRSLLNNKNFKLVNGDVRDANLLEKVISSGINTIIHLAAQIHVDRSIIEPKETYETNVLGTINLLELARRYDVEKFIYGSTSEVYGSAEYVPMDEKHPLNPMHPYGASKLAADRMCFSYIQTYGANITIVRLFNTFGPRQKDTGYGGAISIFVKRILNDRPPIIYGDGKQSRDYLYIEDAVNAYDLLLESKKFIREPVNFGTGKDVTILFVASKIIELFGKKGKIKPVHVAPRPGEVRRLIADNRKAKELLGWAPKYRFDEGLKKFLEWYRNYRFEEWEKPK